MSDKQNIQEYSKETIRIHIRDMQDKPIANAKVTLLAMGQKAGQKIPLDTPTDSNGEILFNSKLYLKDINRFEITIEHTDYYTYPKNRVRKLCRSYEYGHLCQESFEKIPVFYYNGTTLTLSQSHSTTKYTLQDLSNQDSHNHTQEYYIQLQENQKNLTIYKDRNLTQESAYALYNVDEKFLSVFESLAAAINAKCSVENTEIDSEILEAIECYEQEKEAGKTKTYNSLEEYKKAMCV